MDEYNGFCFVLCRGSNLTRDPNKLILAKPEPRAAGASRYDIKKRQRQFFALIA